MTLFMKKEIAALSEIQLCHAESCFFPINYRSLCCKSFFKTRAKVSVRTVYFRSSVYAVRNIPFFSSCRLAAGHKYDKMMALVFLFSKYDGV
jgi:hypothetical protein